MSLYQFDQETYFEPGEILRVYENPALTLESYAVYSPDRTSVLSMIVNYDQNIVVSESSQYNFICVGEYSFKDFEVIRRSCGGLVDLFVSRPGQKGKYKYWGARKIRAYTEDSNRLKLFRLFQKKMAPIEGREQKLSAVICLTKTATVNSCHLSLDIKIENQDLEFDFFDPSIFK